LRPLRTLALILVLWSTASALAAQDLDVFDSDDFVDPEILQVVVDGKTTSAGFFATYVSSGYISDYQNRSTFTQESPLFVRLANSVSYKNFQASFKVVSLDGESEKALFRNKFTLEGDYYFKLDAVPSGSAGGPAEAVPFSNRLRIAWDQYRREKGEISSAVTCGLDFTAGSLLPGQVMRIEYTWVNASRSDDGSNRHYLSLNYRSPLQAFENGSKILVGFGVGAERTLRQVRLGAVRTELAFEFPLFTSESKLRLTYAPSYQLNQGRSNQELSLLFSPPTFARLFGAHRRAD
jgi:hypothetical protein